MNREEFGSKYVHQMSNEKYVHQMSNERLITYLIITCYETIYKVVTPIPIRLIYFV